MQKYYSVPEVAKILGVHDNTVLYWIKMGYLESTKRNKLVGKQHNMISVSELNRIKKTKKLAS